MYEKGKKSWKILRIDLGTKARIMPLEILCVSCAFNLVTIIQFIGVYFLTLNLCPLLVREITEYVSTTMHIFSLIF